MVYDNHVVDIWPATKDGRFFTPFFHRMSSIKTILYVHKTLKNDQHPVMLYLYEDKPYRISPGYSATEKEWDEAQGRFRKNVDNYKAKTKPA